MVNRPGQSISTAAGPEKLPKSAEVKSVKGTTRATSSLKFGTEGLSTRGTSVAQQTERLELAQEILGRLS